MTLSETLQTAFLVWTSAILVRFVTLPSWELMLAFIVSIACSTAILFIPQKKPGDEAALINLKNDVSNLRERITALSMKLGFK